MCRLLALIQPDAELLSAAVAPFGALAEAGIVPEGTEPGHHDGWGVVALHDGETVLYEKQPESAADNDAYAHAFQTEHDIDVVIAHVRKALVGDRRRANTQPFQYAPFAFAHNGTILDADTLPLPDDLASLRKGTADSELVFLWFVSRLREARDHTSAFLSAAHEIALRDRTAANILCTDGARLFVLRDCNESNERVAAHNLCDTYYTLYIGKKDNRVFAVSSEELPLHGITWQPVPNHTVVVIDLETGKDERLPIP